MKIVRDREKLIYKEKNRQLGNCFTITVNNQDFYYEFDIKDDTAIVYTKDLKYVLEAVDEFRKYNYNITTFRTLDGNFYKTFDSIPLFKLPLNIIQPSQIIIDEDKYNAIAKYLQLEQIKIPVTIIDDEYVCVDGNTRLLYLAKNDFKMVDVYMAPKTPKTLPDLIYMAKEMNITSIFKTKVVAHQSYVEFWQNLYNGLYN